MGGSGVSFMVFAGLLLVLRIPAVSNDGSSSINDSSSTELTVENVYRELMAVSAEWERLGFLLKVRQHRLEAIKRDYRFVDDCYREMIRAWYNANPHASWDEIIRAVDQMGHKRLAESIRKRYTHGECTGKHADAEVSVDLGNHKERMRELESEFNNLAFKVMTSMEDKVDLKRVKFWLIQKRFIEGTHVQLISRAENLLEVFGHLRSYWNFLDYGLLKILVTEFGNDEVKQSLEMYIHKLTMFRKSVTVSEFRMLWSNEIDAPPDSSKLVIKLNKTQSELTLQDVEELRLNVAKSYSLVNFALMYGDLQEGSVVLTWFVPSSITPRLVQDVRNGGSGFLKEHNVTEVSIDGHTIAIVDSDWRVWNLVPSTTTPVRFWNARYTYLLQPGKDINLSCSKTCAKASPIWYHTLSKDPWLPISQIATGPELELSLHQPPVTTDVGYFCCACVGDDPKVHATCFGVAYMPHVTHFTITRDGKAVSGVHIGDHIRVECEVYGFPSHVDIAGYSQIAESPPYTEVRLTWYSKMQYINIPHATINHSGIYTCAALLHASPDLYVMTENTKRSIVVYAPPTITDFGRRPNVIYCIVKSAVMINITWLINGKVVNYGTCVHASDTDDFTCAIEIPTASRNNGQYECVVNTAYETREISQVVTQHSMLMEIWMSGWMGTLIGILIKLLMALMVGILMEKYERTWMEILFTIVVGTLIEALTGTSVEIVVGTLMGTLMPLMIVTWKAKRKFEGYFRYLQGSKPFTPDITIIIGGVSHPNGIAVNDRGDIVVADCNCVSIFTSSGKKIMTFSSRLGCPSGVAFDGAGNILVTDVKSHSIKKFTPEGEFLTAVGTEGNKSLEFKFDSAAGIDINHKNKKIYICDYLNNRIQVLNEDFAFCSSWGSTGSGDEFIFPQDVALGSTGSVYIADSLDHCIKVFTPEGKFMRKFGKKGSGEGELSYPSSVSIDSNDIVYVTERDNHRVSIFTSQGKFVRSFGTKGTNPGEFNKPHGIAVDTSGLVYVSDADNNRVQGFKKLPYAIARLNSRVLRYT